MSHHRKVFVFKDVNYGSSKTSTTVNTATNPADLAEGAVGIYGTHRVGSTNKDKVVLITDGGAEAAGTVPVATFSGDEIFIAMGTADGAILSNPIEKSPAARHTFTGKVYTAPVKGVSIIGASDTSGKLNFPSVIMKGDLVSIRVTNRNSKIAGQRSPFDSERYNVELAAGDNAYQALTKLVAKFLELPQESRTLIETPAITSNATGAAATNTATLAAVNGATTLTSSAAHGIGINDWVVLEGALYQAVTGTTGSTLVLDRPYTGATKTIANADFIDAGAVAPTEYGLKITDASEYLNNEVSVQGVLENATIQRTVLPTTGSGTYDHVVRTEKEFKSMLGTSDQITRYIPLASDNAVRGANYDMYVLNARNSNYANGDPGSVFKIVTITILFFVSATDTTGKNQSDFEDIMSVLFTGFPIIS
jgi:hypothetical protein